MPQVPRGKKGHVATVERGPNFQRGERRKVAANSKPPMKANHDPSLAETTDTRHEARALPLEAGGKFPNCCRAALTSKPVPTATRINQLHEEVARCAADSKQSLQAALVGAWSAGRLLVAEKRRVRKIMGAGAWLSWLEQNFRGSRRTASRYMRLAETVVDVSSLQGLSLRQAYHRLDIATEPKSRAESVRVALLPAHVRLAAKLVRTLKPETDLEQMPPEQITAYRQDLRALYERLHRLFEQRGLGRLAPV